MQLNNKNTRTTTYLTSFSNVSIANFEQVSLSV